MAIIMGKGSIEAIYGLMGWKGLMYPTETKVTHIINLHQKL